MSEWEDFCEGMGIDAHDPEQFEELLASWSREYQQEVALATGRAPQARSTGLANPNCSRCGGTGYIRRYRHVEHGRCFKCFPG